MKVPATNGVPFIVIVLLLQLAVTPVGRPVEIPIPVAPVVEIVILGESAVLIQRVGFVEGAAAVFDATTVIVPDAFTTPHPPVRGIK